MKKLPSFFLQLTLVVAKPSTLMGVIVLFIIFYCLPAPARVPIMLGMGDSISEGVQAADANLRTQPFSYLNLLARQMGIRFPLPLIKSGPLGTVGETIFRYRLSTSVLPANLSVSGADVNSLLNRRADAVREEEINSERDLVLFPRMGSQIEIAETTGSPLIICWIGNNDVLSAALSFDEYDASQMTPLVEFESDFYEITDRLGQTGGNIVFANIPDILNIGFMVDRQDLIKFLGSDFGLGEGDYTSIVVMLLIRLGMDDGNLLQNQSFILDAREVAMVRARIEVFNQIIEEAANSIGMPVVDINTFFEEAINNPPVFLGIPITPRFLGGFLSLDGVHPSNIANALIANAFIETINSHFNTDIPSLSDDELVKIFLEDPSIDKDDDGRARGRPGAGLLETLSPFLGISGDKDDFVFDDPQTRFSLRRRKQFIEQFLALKGKDPRTAYEWDLKDAFETFREIFGLNVLNKTSKK